MALVGHSITYRIARDPGPRQGRRVALNFGDVFSYALAKVRGLPLLYQGDDCSQTDVVSAL